jgi:hypothetical protein
VRRKRIAIGSVRAAGKCAGRAGQQQDELGCATARSFVHPTIPENEFASLSNRECRGFIPAPDTRALGDDEKLLTWKTRKIFPKQFLMKSGIAR